MTDTSGRGTAVRFAEILGHLGERLHIGCVMAAGSDWVEVSLPERTELGSGLSVRFLPSRGEHQVTERWRSLDRVGLVYVKEGPGTEEFSEIPGLLDPRPASLKEPKPS